MHPDMFYEHVVYQNPFLAIRIWQIDEGAQNRASDETRIRLEQNWQQSRYSGWHYHEEVEFLLVLKGELTVFCKEERISLQPGDIALFGSSEPHTTLQTNDGSMSYIVFQIDLRKYWDPSTLNSMQHFSEVIRPLSSVNYIFREKEDVRLRMAELIREIYVEMNESKVGYELAVSSAIKSMLLQLLRNDHRQQLHYNNNSLLTRLQPALTYVEERLDERISVADASKLVNMSYTHFIKTFKKGVGMSFTDFVVLKRIKKAEQLLLTCEHLSIAEIAESVGFTNIGHFYEMFRRYNDCSPKQFKLKLQDKSG
ncbi:AraC family transcriptional regulator [Cohnella sp. AR92]|uniref:AraC family transcriptional regulator n=1 Tax=Cohnella sp. AR92 TaxID=648716 RepID=UPI000F8D69CB|nr:AraC family transcriptional regulator [Cohnella sp. AR92]RUS43532.1 AraC family transcriptional regulator [Cohnella sp. AR92]